MVDGGKSPQDHAVQFFVGYVGSGYTSSIHHSCGSSSCSSSTSRSSSSSGSRSGSSRSGSLLEKKGGRHWHCASMSPL